MFTAIFTVIYPSIEPYFVEFLNSLSNQSDKDFRLYIVNDGLSNAERLLKRTDLIAKEIKATGSPSKLRKIGIEWIIDENAEAIIFADSDDHFEQNRIEVVKDFLKEIDIVVNELKLVGKGISHPVAVLGKHFQEGETIHPQAIKSMNFMGLSNTGISVKKIPSDFAKIPDSIIAFDWAFYSMCLDAGCSVTFTEKTATYYRQHQKNVTSLLLINKDQLLRGARVKRDHYSFLAQYNEEYREKSEVFHELFEMLKNDDAFAETYKRRVGRSLPDIPLWWEIIKSPEELGL